MNKPVITSTEFRDPELLRDGDHAAKVKQEQTVGDIFASAYERLTGLPLTGNTPSAKEPPDRLFRSGHISIAAEFFEVGRFYETRAFYDGLIRLIYSKFGSREVSDRLTGVQIIMLTRDGIRFHASSWIKHEWRRRNIRDGLERAAEELVDLVIGEVPSREAIPEGTFVDIPVDEYESPALSAVAWRVVCERWRSSDGRRSDGLAAPLVLAPGGTYVDFDHVQEATARTISKKTLRRGAWDPFDRAILVAHDIPRYRNEPPLLLSSELWLSSVASSVGAPNAFDEMWFVSRMFSETNVVRIF